jgi:hypothetical protein
MNQAIIDMLDDVRSKMLQDMVVADSGDFVEYQRALSHVLEATDHMKDVENS